MKKYSIVVLGVLLAACSGPKLKSEQKDIPFVGTFSGNRFVMDNGLKVIVVEDHSSPTFAYHTWFNVGSKDEKPGNTGLAHLFEHMMFKTTKNLKSGEFDRQLEEAGAEGENAFTSRDYTAYVQELPADKLDLIARLEAERMENLLVDQKAFKTETEVVQNERRYRNENSPSGLMYQALYEVAYKEHSYHWPVIGYQKDLDRMNATDAMAFYQNFYSPSNATIVVVGDVTPSQVLKTVDKYYGKIEARQRPLFMGKAEPPQTGPRRKKLSLNIQAEKLLMAFRVPPAGEDPKLTATIEILQGLLSDGKSSRLTKTLVDEGISTSVWTGSSQHTNEGLYMISTDLQKGKRARLARSVILRELNKLGRKPVQKDELDRAKNLMKFDFFTGMGSNSAKARFLGRSEITMGSFKKGLEVINAFDSVTPEDIQNVVKQYFTPAKRIAILGVPKS